MLLDVLTSLMVGLGILLAPLGERAAAWRPAGIAASFRPLAREVTNWRGEAAGALDLPLAGALGLRIGIDPRGLSRCVRLNNYWCIKRAGWAGEIAADAEGHVAFASAQEGAIVAAVLLRKYYVDYGRHSALAIVSHWAPANCGLARALPGLPVGLRALAPRGLRTTLRGRWLAAHGRGSVGARGLALGPRLRPSRIVERPVAMVRAPALVPGGGEIPLAPMRLASLSFDDAPISPGKSAASPVTSCASETERIGNYAARAIPGIVAGVNEDLGLFDTQGNPTPRLALLMANMAAVEIGPLRVDQGLVDAAVERYVAQRQAAAGK